ncbi:hypothetical protein BJ508DRAFT_333754 [Ascobolus immersus RN42]|uniref:Uncharacterized protein n=1 Tax=Ascobolus immersus RN42 TaxID=1160509 RepID=A0A3N4HPP1_ASCIM|nr:hypothetical protein BJ508DRAFT_333754 [Ascobolus immersus RN42]
MPVTAVGHDSAPTVVVVQQYPADYRSLPALSELEEDERKNDQASADKSFWSSSLSRHHLLRRQHQGQLFTSIVLHQNPEIVGATVGGISLLLITVLAYFLYRYRKRLKNALSSDGMLGMKPELEDTGVNVSEVVEDTGLEKKAEVAEMEGTAVCEVGGEGRYELDGDERVG